MPKGVSTGNSLNNVKLLPHLSKDADPVQTVEEEVPPTDRCDPTYDPRSNNFHVNYKNLMSNSI